LLVTSSQPREGKTSTALNLAITLSQLGRRVLVVDADLRRPRLHKALGLPGSVGLSNLLSGGGDLAAMIQPTSASGLSILASGPAPPNPAELLDSEEFAELAARLGADPAFDHVIFDSPPILSVADAAIMAGRMDGVILVVQAGSTPRESVRRAAEKLRVVKARTLGALLNRADHFGDSYYRSYAYYSEPDAPMTAEKDADGPVAAADPPDVAARRMRRGVRAMPGRRIRSDN
jgi:capsular exopolysaccharide synthesis family protein